MPAEFADDAEKKRKWWKKMPKDMPMNGMRRNDDSLKSKCLRQKNTKAPEQIQGLL